MCIFLINKLKFMIKLEFKHLTFFDFTKEFVNNKNSKLLHKYVYICQIN